MKKEEEIRTNGRMRVGREKEAGDYGRNYMTLHISFKPLHILVTLYRLSVMAMLVVLVVVK